MQSNDEVKISSVANGFILTHQAKMGTVGKVCVFETVASMAAYLETVFGEHRAPLGMPGAFNINTGSFGPIDRFGRIDGPPLT